jgi:hypothetical protein
MLGYRLNEADPREGFFKNFVTDAIPLAARFSFRRSDGLVRRRPNRAERWGRKDAMLVASRPGRLGSPMPLHERLQPIHFEKMACTSCHSGPAPREEALRMMTSLAHGLGEKGHRTGDELPAMVGGVFMPAEDGRLHPHKAMWPAYWARWRTINRSNRWIPNRYTSGRESRCEYAKTLSTKC